MKGRWEQQKKGWKDRVRVEKEKVFRSEIEFDHERNDWGLERSAWEQERDQYNKRIIKQDNEIADLKARLRSLGESP